jgi:hypothetical protein
MKNSLSSKLAATALLAGALILTSNSAFAAAKKPLTHTRTGTYQTSGGKSGTFSETTTRKAGEKTESHQGTITKTGDNTLESKGTITGPNGKTSNYDIVTTKTDDGRSSTSTITEPHGTRRSAQPERRLFVFAHLAKRQR